MRGPDRRLAGVGITLASIVLTVVSRASHPVAEPTPAATVPHPTTVELRHLASPIVLEVMLGQSPSAAGGCPAGSAALSGPGAGPGLCYRQLGRPVTINSAAISFPPARPDSLSPCPEPTWRR